jgi:AraC-like DNA-binding protein/mannose-6-phosphate isomerase-like protein (cupin superfamily)
MNMEPSYTTIDAIYRLAVSSYNERKKRQPFHRILNKLPETQITSVKPKSAGIKSPSLLSDAEFFRIIGSFPVDVCRILSNPNRELIAEPFVIPADRDVSGFLHMPYIDDRMHSHDHFEINYVYRGQARQQIDKEERILKEGEFCIISPHMHHNVLVDDTESLVISLMVRKSTFDLIFGSLLTHNDLLASFFRNTLYQKGQSQYLLFVADSNDQIVRKLIQDLMIETNSDQKYANVYANCLVQELFYLLLRAYSNTILYYGGDKWADKQTNFSMILAYVQSNYCTATLESVAAFFHYSESYLSRLFKQNMHESFNKVIQNLKMEKAEEYLANTDQSIAWICENIGYDSPDYFTKKFKQKHGCTPSQFRKE